MLRSRRERLQPAEAGFPSGGRRRTRGLRREEVAALAAISPTYYTFLEQGRPVRPSRQVLDALARALRLSEAERAHLHQLALDPAAPGEERAESLAPAVAEIVERLDPSPAYVTGRRWDVLAANRAARVLWTDWASMEPATRNMVWWTFTDPAAPQVLVEWEAEARALLARFRAAAARHPADRGFSDLVARLQAASSQVREWWPRHDIEALSPGVKRLRHHVLGEVEFQYAVLQVADDPEQKLVTFSASAPDRARIAALIAGAGGWPER